MFLVSHLLSHSLLLCYLRYVASFGFHNRGKMSGFSLMYFIFSGRKKVFLVLLEFSPIVRNPYSLYCSSRRYALSRNVTVDKMSLVKRHLCSPEVSSFITVLATKLRCVRVTSVTYFCGFLKVKNNMIFLV